MQKRSRSGPNAVSAGATYLMPSGFMLYVAMRGSDRSLLHAANDIVGLAFLVPVRGADAYSATVAGHRALPDHVGQPVGKQNAASTNSQAPSCRIGRTRRWWS